MHNCRFKLHLDVSLYQDVALQVTFIKMHCRDQPIGKFICTCINAQSFYKPEKVVNIVWKLFRYTSSKSMMMSVLISFHHPHWKDIRRGGGRDAKSRKLGEPVRAKFYVFGRPGWWCVNDVQQHPKWSRWVREIGRLGNECSTWFHPPIFRVAIHWLWRVTGV